MFGSPPPTADGTFEEWAAEKPSASPPATGSVTGLKLEDLDGDPSTTNDRPNGIGGITIYVDVNGNGLNDEIQYSTTTAADGSYTINDIPVGTYNVYEVNPSTHTVVVGSASVTVIGGQTVTAPTLADFENVTLHGVKFEDHNGNGVRDTGDDGLAGWIINVGSGTATTDASGNWSLVVGPGTFAIQEAATGQPWTSFTQTFGNAGYSVTTVSGEDVGGHDFGNIKLGAGGGHTLGYWSNKNGKAAMEAGPGGMPGALAMLSGLNLRTATGGNFDPTTYAQFRTWLLNATATNMSYMLSAQLAAMAIGVHVGNVNGGSSIYAPGTLGANAAGFTTVSALIAEANTELGTHGTAFSGDAWRPYQETLKNAIDMGNNNLNFAVALSSWTDTNGNGVIDAGEI